MLNPIPETVREFGPEARAYIERYRVVGDDWEPDETFATEGEAESFAEKHRSQLGSYYIELAEGLAQARRTAQATLDRLGAPRVTVDAGGVKVDLILEKTEALQIVRSLMWAAAELQDAKPEESLARRVLAAAIERKLEAAEKAHREAGHARAVLRITG